MSDRAVTIALTDELGNPITGENPLPVGIEKGFNIPEYDLIVLAYVAAGNGAGEVGTVTYSFEAGTVAILTLAYNGDDKLISVTKT